MAQWYESLASVLTSLPSDKAGQLIDHITGSNEMVSQVNSLLLQVQRDPSTAGHVSTEIISMRGLPSLVRDLASGLPGAARDQTGVALPMLIAQIQSALPRSRWF